MTNIFCIEYIVTIERGQYFGNNVQKQLPFEEFFHEVRYKAY